MPINAEVFARTKSEEAGKHVTNTFSSVTFLSTDEVQDVNHEIIIYEVADNDNIDKIRDILRTNNFFLFISGCQQDELFFELSKEFFFVFCLRSDPVKEIEVRFNLLTQHKLIKRELETKSEELESTIFELAFASTNVLEQNEFLEQMAKKDGLTMLYNHSYFKDKLKDEISRSERYNNHFCLALFDIDFFKKVNDTYGHLKGDEVLKAFSNIIKECIRSTDIAARYGGEEFAIIFTETDMEHSIMVVERIMEKLSETVFSSDTDCFKITFSAGLTSYQKCYKDLEFMISIADKALYMSKSTGRNKYTVLDDDPDDC